MQQAAKWLLTLVLVVICVTMRPDSATVIDGDIAICQHVKFTLRLTDNITSAVAASESHHTTGMVCSMDWATCQYL